MSRRTCSCGHYTPVRHRGGLRGRGRVGLLVNLLRRRPEIAAAAPVAASVDESVTWAA